MSNTLNFMKLADKEDMTNDCSADTLPTWNEVSACLAIENARMAEARKQ